MTIGRLLTIIGLAAVLLAVLGCDERYELFPAGGDMANLVYRLDHETGQVCALRWWKNLSGSAEGFKLVGCEGGDSEPPPWE